MNCKSVIFDLDGTLTDSGEGITKCVRLALEHFGIPVKNLDDLRFFCGASPAGQLCKSRCPRR